MNNIVGNEKVSNSKSSLIVLIPLIALILVVIMLITIVAGILDVITDTVNNLLDTLTNPVAGIERDFKSLTNGLSYLFNTKYWKPEKPSCEFLIIINQEQVDNIKDTLTKQAIDLEQSCLTDYVLKKMMLVNYMTMSTSDTQVAIPISKEDYDKKENEGTFSYWEGDDDKKRKKRRILYVSLWNY